METVERESRNSLKSFKVYIPMRKPAVKYCVNAMITKLPNRVSFSNDSIKDLLIKDAGRICKNKAEADVNHHKSPKFEF